MNIRTITFFDNPGFPLAEARVERTGVVAGQMKAALAAAGYETQTVRLALPPFAVVMGGDARQVVPLARDLERACTAHSIDYATFGPARPGDAPEFFSAIPEALGATERVFASAVIADRETGISLSAIRLAAEVIHRIATLAPDGFANVRFAALANVPPGVPFLPAAYHDHGGPAVSIGVEAADLAVQAMSAASSLADARRRLIDLIEADSRAVVEVVHRTCPSDIRVVGIDFSLAPYPEPARSIGTAIESLAGTSAGRHGTLAAVAFLADALDRAHFPRTGYSGVFLPVLEDAVLAARAAEGQLAVADLLLCSSVCGTGLDTVPLPGDITTDALAAILLDVAALAMRLDKPLSARLMPLPGKQAGDVVMFDFAFFAPSRVLAAHALGVGGLLGHADSVDLRPRRPDLGQDPHRF
jgi:uncharacterized protein (UPF0210 family)